MIDLIRGVRLNICQLIPLIWLIVGYIIGRKIHWLRSYIHSFNILLRTLAVILLIKGKVDCE